MMTMDEENTKCSYGDSDDVTITRIQCNDKVIYVINYICISKLDNILYCQE